MQLIAFAKASSLRLPGRRMAHSKTWLIMRLTIVLLAAACLQVNAKGYAQRITLDERNVPLEKVLQKIKKQSNLHMVYREEWMESAPRISVYLVNRPLQEALDSCLKGQAVTYELIDRTIVLKKREKERANIPTVLSPLPPPILITGRIMGSDGLPLSGVSIMVKGKATGVSTDGDGRFSIDVSDEKAVLVVSYVGFETQEIPVKGKRNIEVKLSLVNKSGDDVVVIAYGTQKKVTVTGAVSTVTTDQLRQSSSASLANALAGRLSGLTSIQSGGGQPGRDDATMYLRGAATTNGKSPLILIDGVPRDNIRTLDPNEVASVTVLKDASSTAVFGVRGANGVILITTRRGSEGKTQLNANIEQSYTSFTREPERLHSVDYMRLRNEAAANDGITPLPFSQADMDKYANPLKGLDPADPDYASKAKLRYYMYPDHDYYREYIARYTPQTRVNLSASGGTSKLTYFVNGVYLHQGGNLRTQSKSVLGYDPSSWMDRYNFRANLDFKISPSVKTFLNIGSYIEQVNMPAAWLYGYDTQWMMRDLLYQSQTILPITPGPTTIDGFGVAPGQITDPGYMDRSAFEIMNRMGYRNELRSNLNSSLGLDWDLSRTVTRGLSLKGMISYDAKATTAMEGDKQERLYLALVNSTTDQLNYAVKRSSESMLNLVKGADSRYNVNMQASLNYNRSFGNHAVSGMALAQRDYWESTAGEIPFNVVGFAGRVTYAYASRYLAEVNVGYNGSEQFAPKNRYGFFPAASLGWVVSNEKFFRPLANTVSNLKLRASYGRVGNDQMGGARFLYLDNITMGGGPLGSLGNGQGINQGLLGNPAVGWEVAEKQNFGVDLGLFRDLTVSFDYFTEHRSKILISRGTVPEFQGVRLGNIPRVNMGKVDNQGYEIELTYNKSLSKDLSLMVRGNYGYNHNIVRFIDEPVRDQKYAYRYRGTGYSLGQQWGYRIDYGNGNGYFNSQRELDDYLAKTKYGFGNPRVGDFKYLDLNGDGIIDDKDMAPIKYTSIPGVTYGFMFSLKYKNLELTPFFQGVSRYSGNYAWQGAYENIIRGTYFGYHRTAWTAERYAKGEKITYPALSTHTTTNHTANDFFIMNRAFLRLKNIELAYTLPAGALKRLAIKSLRVYVSAQNYLTWDHLRMKHLDPENNDSIGYPVTKMLNFGTNITF